MRLIDGDKLAGVMREEIQRYADQNSDASYHVMMYATTLVNDAPTIDAEPVRHGEWKQVCFDEQKWQHELRECSNCKQYSVWAGDEYDYNYCPNCGAKMDGGRT